MADYKKISDFSEASAFEDTDKLLVSKAKITYTILGSKIKAFCQAAISALVAQADTDASSAAASKTAAQNAQTAAESAKTAATQQATNATNANTAAQQAKADAQAAATAMQECAAYSSTKSYAVGNMATYNGSTYRCTAACTGVVPTNTANWLLIAAKGTDGQGAGDMLAATYDPAGGAKQVAFSDDVNTALAGKQATLTFDTTPTANSTNPVTSGGIKIALEAAGGLFVTNLTYANNTYTADHTLAEILAAYQAGKTCILVYSLYYVCTLHYISSGSYAEFAYVTITTDYRAYGILITVSESSITVKSYNNYDARSYANRSTAVNVADTNYTMLMARGESLNGEDTTPAVNGAIAWTYG